MQTVITNADKQFGYDPQSRSFFAHYLPTGYYRDGFACSSDAEAALDAYVYEQLQHQPSGRAPSQNSAGDGLVLDPLSLFANLGPYTNCPVTDIALEEA